VAFSGKLSKKFFDCHA